MAKEIVVEIDSDGNFDVDMINFHGVGCKAVAKAFEVMGKVSREVIKSEYYQNDAQSKLTNNK